MKQVLTSRLFFLFLSVATLTLATGCDKDDDDNNNNSNMKTLTATINGAQEVPAVTTNATGTMSGTYNTTSNLLTYTLNWNGLSGAPTMMHFHGPAMAGQTAGPVVTITGFPANATGTHNSTATLTEAQEADLLAGKWYVNIHTQANAGGEIRGQVAVQ